MLVESEKRGLALSRGSIVLIMPAVHTVLMYSSDTVKEGWLGILLGFLAEQPGAQLFMLQMGLFIGLGRPKSVHYILKRFCILLLAGYVLNFLRLVLPYGWGGLPPTFFAAYQIPDDGHRAITLLLTGDILQFAALGYLFCYIVQRWLRSLSARILLFLLLLFLSPLTWEWTADLSSGNHLMGLLTGLPPQTFFPFFPWICYPLGGLMLAEIMKTHGGRISHVGWVVTGILLMGVGAAISLMEPTAWNSNFYRLGPGGTLFHLGAAISWNFLFMILSQKISAHPFVHFVAGLSHRITAIYFFQWILIIWLIPVFGYNTLNLTESLAVIGLVTIVSFYLADIPFKKFRLPALLKRRSIQH